MTLKEAAEKHSQKVCKGENAILMDYAKADFIAGAAFERERILTLLRSDLLRKLDFDHSLATELIEDKLKEVQDE